jgi:cytochrome c biogenesis protein CcmG/thiol:disulfide interchange protein DsbE
VSDLELAPRGSPGGEALEMGAGDGDPGRTTDELGFPVAGGGNGTPGSVDPPHGGGGGGDSGDDRKVPRSRLVLYVSMGVAIIVAILIALLASSGPVTPGAAGSPLVGKPAPPVSGQALSGSGQYSLADYSGKWVLVNFSASWCVPCRQETPQLVQFATEHASAGDAVILAISFDPTDKANLAAFLTSSHATWPAIDDSQAQVAYGVTGIPESYFVAPNGIVAAKFIGGVTAAELDSFIKRATPGG